MRLLAAAALLAALPALAQETPAAAPPDYSRENLVRLFARGEEEHKLPPPRVRWHIGYVEFRALGMDWRVMYLPIAMPLAGTRLDQTADLPNAFELTNTQIAGARPYPLERPRAVRREIRRVLKMERQR